MRHIIIADHVDQRGLQGEEYSAIFRQGDLDGACGVYSLFMCLNLCGVAECQKGEITLDSVDKRKQFGKMIKEVENSAGLIVTGHDVDEVKNILNKSYRATLNYEIFKEPGKKAIAFVLKHLWEGHPVLMSIKGPKFLHWVVACGMEFNTPSVDAFPTKGDTPERLFLLDPGAAKAKSTLWNSYIVLEAGTGKYPYEYVEEGTSLDSIRVGFNDGVIAIWPKPNCYS